MNNSISVLLLLLTLTPPHLVAEAPAELSEHAENLKAQREVIDLLTQFRTNHDSGCLRQAINQVSSLGDRPGLATFHTTAGVSLRVMRELDRVVDLKFNFEDIPQINVAPPLRNGVVYLSGVAPEAIKDENVRREYESTLRQNREHAARFGEQLELHRLDKRLTDIFVTVMLREIPLTNRVAELDQLLKGSPLSEARRHRLRQAVFASSGLNVDTTRASKQRGLQKPN